MSSSRLDFADEHLAANWRLIAAVIDGAERAVRCASVYVPHGREVGHRHYDYKLGFWAALRHRAVAQWSDDGSLLLGAVTSTWPPTDRDIFHPDAFVGLTHVTAPEREALAGGARGRTRRPRRPPSGSEGASLHVVNPRPSTTRGTSGCGSICWPPTRCPPTGSVTTWIDHVERGGERPSDHAALLADFRHA